MSLPIHCLSPPRLANRRASITRQLDDIGADYVLHDGIDRIMANENEVRGHFGLPEVPATLGDMCCTLGHLAIWSDIARGAGDAAVVLEDDAVLGTAFTETMGAWTAAAMRAADIGVLKIEAWAGPGKNRSAPFGRPIDIEAGLYRLAGPFMGSAAYIVTREAARALLLRHSEPRRPVDHLLFSGDRPSVGFLAPAPVQHDPARFGSDIARPKDKPGPGKGATLKSRLRRARRIPVRFSG